MSTVEAPFNRWELQDDASIAYGHLGRTSGKTPASVSSQQPSSFYLTTAINYTNGPAHMGHAYEGVTADVLVRFHRLLGTEKVYFVTGADEHGQKIANAAAEQGVEPIDLCNKYVTGFQVLNQRLLVSNDDYIRTTSPRHKANAQALWNRIQHDIYLDTYSGWYNVREETFVTDNEAALCDYKDPASGLPLKQVEEESYFFKMSQYQERLLQYIQENPKFIQPEQHRNQILSRLQSDELRDLSITRTTFSWGIKVPEGFHDHHVMYVWVDALSNYLTGVNALQTDPEAPAALAEFWPAQVHIIGKDILWFHTVIWPCLLMSAGLPLPQTVFAHGFVNDREGKKMSKSLGNVVDPHDMLDQFTTDTFRWYLCKEAPYGGELSFGPENLREMHHADLCDTLGNLVHRATHLCQKYCNGVVPAVAAVSPLPVDVAEIMSTYQTKMSQIELQGGAMIAIQGFRDLNGYLQEAAPWKLKDALEKQQVIVRTTLETIYILGHLILPFLPQGGALLFQKLNTPPQSLADLKLDGTNLKEGTVIEIGDVLYSKVVSEEEKADAAAAANKKKESYAEAQQRKKDAKAKARNQQQQQNEGDSDQPEFTKIDIRVGQISKVWYHENAAKLFCEEINLGSEKRQVASGLRDHYSLEEMQDRKVLVVCNLKAVKLHEFVSEGMVLAAKGDDGKVELISPPADAVIGERVFVEGLEGEPVSSTQVKKKKIWEEVATGLKTGEGGVAQWSGKNIMTSAGVCVAASLVGAPIS